MNLKSFLKIGFKVLIAVSTGIAIFVGIDKSSNKDRIPYNSNSRNKNSPEDFNKETANDNGSDQSTIPSAPNVSEGLTFVEKVRNVQNTFSKLLAFAQIITSTVDNISRIFGNNNGQYYQQGFNGNEGQWYDRSQGKVYLKNGAVLNRISPFIMEVEYTPYSNTGYNQNPYYNNNGNNFYQPNL